MATTASIASNATPRFISIGDCRGNVAQDVIARGLRKVRVGKFIADVEVQFVDGAVLLSGIGAERIPGRVFEKHAVEAVKTIVVAVISPALARTGLLQV